MDPYSVLRLQTQNTIHKDIPGKTTSLHQQNKRTTDIKSSMLHPSQHNIENQDPGSSGPVHVRPGVSRLPVLAKSLHLPTSTDFTQSHCKWEEKPLAGKAKTKKPCTRSVPFDLSQAKTSKVVSENQCPSTVSQTRTNNSNKSVCSSKTKNMNLKHSSTLKDSVKSFGQSGHLNPLQTSVSKPVLSATNSVKTSAEVCSENMNLLTLKDASNTLKASSVEHFQHNHAALLSVLRNEGVTPQSKPYNYLPQRVSVMSHPKAEPNTGFIKSVFSPNPAALKSILQNEGVKTGGLSDRATSVYTPMRVPVKKKSADPGPVSSIKAVQFSPDAAALHSILENEGVKTVGLGATPRNSVCPSGRGTSIYTAQRVPVRKIPTEPNRGPVASLKDTPGQKWTPQRVPARHQPISAMKWYTSSQQSPYAITPGLRGYKANVCPQQDKVVQRLFDDQDEQTTDQETESPPEEETHEKAEEKEQAMALPFIQAPERQSVIFFSTGKKMFRDSRFKKPEISDNKEQRSPEESLSVLQQSWQINTIAQTLPTDLINQKTVINPALAMLRKRLPPLEELRLDEEVATYTSVSVPTASGFLSPRPRCGNPLATILHFEEATRFVPISFDMSPDSPYER